MYVKDRDVEVFSCLLEFLNEAIAAGAKDDEYWQTLSNDAHDLYEKMKNQRDRDSYKREVRKQLRLLRKQKK